MATLADQRCGEPFGGRHEIFQLDHAAGRSDLETLGCGGEGRPLQGFEVDQRVCIDLRFGKKPRASGQVGVAVLPVFHILQAGRTLDFGNGIEVHRFYSVTLMASA